MPRQQAARMAIVPLAAEIDLTNRGQVYDRLYAAFISGVTVVIADFTGTRFCDCASLRRLVAVQRRAAAHGVQLRLVIPPRSPVRRVVDLLCLDTQLLIYASAREASAWLPPAGAPLPRTASLAACSPRKPIASSNRVTSRAKHLMGRCPAVAGRA